MNKLTPEILERMRVPKVHWQATIAKIPERCPHKAELIAWAENAYANVRKPRGLLLHGDYGRGKSAAAAICLKAAAVRGLLGYWVSAREIPELQIKNVEFDAEQTAWERMITVPLLVIDELIFRADKYTEQSAEMVFRYRVDSRLATIVTTNLSLSALGTNFPSLLSVMAEAVLPVKVQGHDFRGDISKELV